MTRSLSRVYILAVLQFTMIVLISGCSERKVSNGTVARYAHFVFLGDPTEFREMYAGDEDKQIVKMPLWIRTKDGKKNELSSISESLVKSWDFQVINGTDYPGSHAIAGSNSGLKLYCMIEGCSGGPTFTFLDGHVSGFRLRESFRNPLEGVMIGPSRDGEFLSFPISRENLIRVFGAPNFIGENWVKAPPT